MCVYIWQRKLLSRNCCMWYYSMCNIIGCSETVNFQNVHCYFTEAPLYLYFHQFIGDLCKLAFLLPEPGTFSSLLFNSVNFWGQLNFLLCCYDQIVWCFLLKCVILNKKFILQQKHNQTQFSAKCEFCCMVKEMEFYCQSVDYPVCKWYKCSGLVFWSLIPLMMICNNTKICRIIKTVTVVDW